MNIITILTSAVGQLRFYNGPKIAAIHIGTLCEKKKQVTLRFCTHKLLVYTKLLIIGKYLHPEFVNQCTCSLDKKSCDILKRTLP